MKNTIFIILAVLCFHTLSQARKYSPTDSLPLDEYYFSVAAEENILVLGNPSDDDFGASFGSAKIYERQNDGSWTFIKEIYASDPTQLDNFGRSVGISGNYIAVGATNDDDNGDNSGSVYLFHKDEGGVNNWGEIKKVAPTNGQADENFGRQIVMKNNTLLVSSITGKVYLFGKDQGGLDNWGFIKELVTTNGDIYGNLDISDEFALVGDPYDNEENFGAGAVFLYGRNEGGEDNWGLIKKILPNEADSEHYNFGMSVSINNDYIVIGATQGESPNGNYYYGQGYANIYHRNQGGTNAWGKVQKLNSNLNPEVYSEFGKDIQITDTAIFISNQEYDPEIFVKKTNGLDGWTYQGYIGPLTSGNSVFPVLTSDYFLIEGYIFSTPSISHQTQTSYQLNNSNGLISAHGPLIFDYKWQVSYDDEYTFHDIQPSLIYTGMEQGSLGILFNDSLTDNYYRCIVSNIFGSDTSQAAQIEIIGELSETSVLQTSGNTDGLGKTVDISGNYAVLGAEGQAFIFKRDNNNGWIEHIELFQSDPASQDNFGHAVAIDGDYAVVSANKKDYLGSYAGAVYVYYKNQGGTDNWGQIKKVTPSDHENSIEFGYSVDISESTLVVGSKRSRVNIFYKDNGGSNEWGEEKYVYGSDGLNGYNFGESVAISGDVLVAGDYQHQIDLIHKGSAYIFNRNEGGADQWGEIDMLFASEVGNFEKYGFYVDVLNNTIAIGAPDHSSGAIYVYEKDVNGTGNWEFAQKILAFDDDNLADFSMDSSMMVIRGGGSGRGYLYYRDPDTDLNWRPVIKLFNEESGSGLNTAIGNSHLMIGTLHYYVGEVQLTQQPADTVGICGNSTIQLTTGGQNIQSFKWQSSTDSVTGFTDLSDNTIFSGSKNDTLEVLAKPAIDSTYYRCVVSNFLGPDTTDVVMLSLEKELPVLTVATPDAYFDSAGMAYVLPGQLVQSATDNCSVLDTTFSQLSFLYTIGDTALVDITLSDYSGNTTEAQAKVSLKDTIRPDFNIIDSTIILGPGGTAEVFAEQLISNVWDNTYLMDTTITGQTSYTVNDADQSFDLTITVADSAGNIKQKVSTINIIVDVTGPVVITQDVTIYVDENGNAAIANDDVISEVTDNYSISDTTISQSNFDCSNIGEITIQVTAEDWIGNSTTEDAVITIADTISPLLSVQDTTIYLDNSGAASVVVGGLYEASDNCTLADVTHVGETNFDCSNVGISNSLEFTAIDAEGNTTIRTLNITVADTISPELQVHDTILYLNGQGEALLAAEEVILSATDNCTMASTNLAQTNFTCADIGINELAITAIDASGNEIVEMISVEVLDTIVPNVIGQNATIVLDQNGEAILNPNDVIQTASDNCAIEDISPAIDTFNCSFLGSTAINVFVTDASGNSAYDLVTVFVEDVTPPLLVTQDIAINLDETGSAFIEPDDVIVSLTDNCNVASTELSQYFFYTSDLGNVTVDVTATDDQGNSLTEQAIVTVQNGTSIDDNLSDVGINVYPNPTTDEINITFADKTLKRSVSVISTSGETLYVGTPTYENIVIDMDNFSAGMYILQIRTNDNLVNAKVFKN